MLVANDTDRARVWPLLLLAAVAATAIVGLFFAATRPQLASPDALRYAQIARNAARGEGLRNEMMQPSNFAGQADGRIVPREKMGFFFATFVFPLWLAGFFGVLGDTNAVVWLAAGVAHVAAVVAFFALALRLLTRREAVVAAILFAANGQLLGYVGLGISEPLFVFEVALALLLLWSIDEHPWAALALGVVLATALFTRDLAKVFVFAFLPLVPFVLRRRRVVMTALAIACFLAARWAWPIVADRINHDARAQMDRAAWIEAPDAAPVDAAPRAVEPPGDGVARFAAWVNRVGEGTLFLFSDLMPGHQLERSVAAANGPIDVAANMDVVWRKWRANLRVTARNFPKAFNPLVFAAFAALPWVRRTDDRRRWWLYLWTWLVLAAHVGVCLLLFSMTRYLVAALPTVVLLAAPGLVALTERMSRPAARVAALAAVVVLGLWPFAFTSQLTASPLVTAEAAKGAGAGDGAALTALGAFVRGHTARDEVVVTDLPWHVAWYGDRMSIWLPADRRQMDLLRRRAEVDWLLLTFQYQGDLSSWRQWIKDVAAAGGEADGFRFVTAGPVGPVTTYLFRATGEGGE